MFILSVVIEKTCFDSETILGVSCSKGKLEQEIDSLKTKISKYLLALNLQSEDLDEKYNTSSSLWFLQNRTEYEKELASLKKSLWDELVNHNYEIFIENEEELDLADFNIVETISLD